MDRPKCRTCRAPQLYFRCDKVACSEEFAQIKVGLTIRRLTESGRRFPLPTSRITMSAAVVVATAVRRRCAGRRSGGAAHFTRPIEMSLRGGAAPVTYVRGLAA